MEKKTVFVNGTFDILHVGHLRLLNYAKSLGEYLHVAIDSDERVKFLKGSQRPINSQEERKEMLLNLKAVDTVSIFNSSIALENTIKDLNPDFMVIGGDYRGKQIIGSQFAKSFLFFDRIDGLSTTEKIQYIANRG